MRVAVGLAYEAGVTRRDGDACVRACAREAGFVPSRFGTLLFHRNGVFRGGSQ